MLEDEKIYLVNLHVTGDQYYDFEEWMRNRQDSFKGWCSNEEYLNENYFDSWLGRIYTEDALSDLVDDIWNILEGDDEDYWDKDEACMQSIEYYLGVSYGSKESKQILSKIKSFNQNEYGYFDAEISDYIWLFEMMTGQSYDYDVFSDVYYKEDDIIIIYPTKDVDMAKETGEVLRGNAVEVEIAEPTSQEMSDFNIPENINNFDASIFTVLSNTYWEIMPVVGIDNYSVCKALGLPVENTYVYNDELDEWEW